MIDYDNTVRIKSLYENVGDVVCKLERDVRIKALYGRVAGSLTQGLNSRASDNDFLVFCEPLVGFEGLSYEDSKDQTLGIKEIRNAPFEGHVYYTKTVENVPIEYEMGYILHDVAQSRIMSQRSRRRAVYPTVFCRSENEQIKCKNLPAQLRKRDEYPYMMMMLLLLDDFFWVSHLGMVGGIIEEYKKENVIDILDTYYTRAYGNCKNFIDDKDTVLVRKYLYTMSHICIMRWILDNGTKPPVGFLKQFEGVQVPKCVKDSVMHFLELNRNADIYKTRYKEKADRVLSDYIGESIVELKQKISGYRKDEVLYDLIRRLEEKDRPKFFCEDDRRWRTVAI